MAHVFAILLLVFTLLAIKRRLQLRYIRARYVYELAAVRDELSHLHYMGRLGSAQWLYEFLHETITRAMIDSYYLTPSWMAHLHAQSLQDTQQKQAANMLYPELQNSPELRKITNACAMAICRYLKAYRAASLYGFTSRPFVRHKPKGAWPIRYLIFLPGFSEMHSGAMV